MKTTAQWWSETKSDEAKLHAWLQRQYVGELAAVNLLSEVLIRFGSEMSEKDWNRIFKVMNQEALHGKWIKELLDARGIKPEKDADSTRRYWNEVLPAVDSFEKASAAAYNAENMRLHRIREIAGDASAPADIRETFQDILPHEEWHEEVFAEMKGNVDLSEFHSKGLEALSLVLT
jgi:rubrerythrin